MFRFDPKLATPWKKGLLKEYSASTDCADDCTAKSYRKRLDALIAGAMGPEEDTTATMVQNTDRGIDAEGQKTSPSKSEKKRARRTRVKRGRPLTAFANNSEAIQKKTSCIVIRNKYNIASAIITAIQHSRFKLNLHNRYQQCRYVPIIFSEK